MVLVSKSFGRVFIRQNPGVYTFANQMGVTGLDKSFGEVTAIEIPSPLEYDKFIEVASSNGADSRWTSSLSGYLPRDTMSPLEILATNKCEFSMQVHYGECSKPTNFADFDSAIVLNNVKLTNYSLSDLIARTSDQRGMVEETASISAGSMYRILPQKFIETAKATLNNIILSNPVQVKSSACTNIQAQCNGGCDIYVAAFASNDGTRGFVYTLDSGITWTRQNVAGFTIDNNSADGNIFFTFFDGTDLVVLMEAKVSGVKKTLIYRMPVSSLGVTTATVTNLVTVNTITMKAADVGSRYIFIAGGSTKAEIWVFDLSLNTLSLLHQNTTVVGFMTCISAMNDDNVIAFNGNNDYIISNTYGLFTAGKLPNVSGSLPLSCTYLSDFSIVVSTHYDIKVTNNGGRLWNTTSALASSSINHMQFYDNITGYLFNSSGIHRTLDGGYTWIKLFDLPSTSLGLSRKLALCPSNPNFIVGVAGPTTVGSNLTSVIIGKS